MRSLSPKAMLCYVINVNGGELLGIRKVFKEQVDLGL